MGLNKKNLVEQIKKIIDKNDGLILIDGFKDGYKYKSKIRIESIIDKKKIDDDDIFAKHILIERIYKKGLEPTFLSVKEQIQLEREGKTINQEYIQLMYVNKDESYKRLDSSIKMIEEDTKNGLTFFYGDGQEYGFTDYDGSIDLEFKVVENKTYYDIYAFYSYAGK